MASLFHKPIKKELSAVLEAKKRPRPRVPRPPPPPPEEDDNDKPPSGPYTDFQVISSTRRGWKYDIMKFESRGKEVDPTKWTGPVKLNRKDYRKEEPVGNDVPPVELTPMLGPDGKPVIGPDGKMVMVGPDGKVPQPGTNTKIGSKDVGPGKGKGKGKQMFKKKTKQVFVVPDDVRQMRREERYPWVMEEGGSAGQVWVGHLDNPDKAQTHGLLVPSGSQFQFVPMHRWYKFQKRPTYRILALEEAEAEYAKTQKNKDPERWLMRKKALNGKGPSEATLATLKAEKQDPGGPSGFGDGMSLRTVDSGTADLFGDDDDEEEKMNRKRRVKEMGGEGDMDEVEYEEDFADDEEKMEMDGDDEETKEMEERLKKEYRSANKMRDGHVDEDEEEDDLEELTGAGLALKKLVKKTEKNEAYDSDDDDRNPYVSEEEELDEEPIPPVLDGPAVLPQNPPPSQPPSAPPTPQSSRAGATPTPQTRPMPKTTSKPLHQHPSSSSRANSPGLGNAVVAKRATSPKAPKQKVIAGGSGSRAGSPLASRASSPVPSSGLAADGSGSRAGSPARADSPPAASQLQAQAQAGSLKRKAADDVPAADGAKPKKKPKRPLEEAMVIAFLREKTDASTKDCIQKFQPYLKEEETKKAFTAMVKKVAIVKGGLLQLRPEFR